MNLKPPSRTWAGSTSTHQLVPLNSPTVWVGLWWLVEILMWSRLPARLVPLATSQAAAKTLAGKVRTHRQLCFRQSKQQGGDAILSLSFFTFFLGRGIYSPSRIYICQHPSRQTLRYTHTHTHTRASTTATCRHISHFAMLMCLSSALFRRFTSMSNKSKYLGISNST